MIYGRKKTIVVAGQRNIIRGFNHSFQAEDFPKALAAMALSDNQDPDWFADSGATSHMKGNEGNLLNGKYYHGPDSLMVGNGTRLPITHTGHSYGWKEAGYR